MRYVALLRGINVGGNNKISMTQLRQCFEDLGFKNVSTYINSGNIFFETSKTNLTKLIKKCEDAIEKTFEFRVVITIISKNELETAMTHAPSWWGKDEKKIIRSDALFVIPPKTANQVVKEIDTKPSGPDKFATHGQVVFWTLPMAEYNKSVVPKIIGTSIYKSITMRSSTTTKKLLELFKQV